MIVRAMIVIVRVITEMRQAILIVADNHVSLSDISDNDDGNYGNGSDGYDTRKKT